MEIFFKYIFKILQEKNLIATHVKTQQSFSTKQLFPLMMSLKTRTLSAEELGVGVLL